MTGCNEFLEAALDSFPEGVALCRLDRQIAFWNRAAEAITGFTAAELLARTAPEGLSDLFERAAFGPEVARGCLVHLRHKHGYTLGALVRDVVLRDPLGAHIGTAFVFHATEGLENLPHGESGYSESIEAGQAELDERLRAAYEEFEQSGRPFGVLWITIDQAHNLRRTHGACACDAMFRKIQHSLVNGLRPDEEIGRWGQDEFLILSHEPFAAALANHAQLLAGLARTTDFRWWGDRVSLTVSVGVARVGQDEALADLLDRARMAMSTSVNNGGNRITLAPGRLACSPS